MVSHIPIFTWILCSQWDTSRQTTVETNNGGSEVAVSIIILCVHIFKFKGKCADFIAYDKALQYIFSVYNSLEMLTIHIDMLVEYG